MPALALDTVLSPFRSSRSNYDEVAICPDRYVPGSWTEAHSGHTRQKWYWTVKSSCVSSSQFRDIVGGDVKTPTKATADELRMQLLIDKVLKEVEAVREQFKAKQGYFEGINPKYLMQTTQSLAFWLLAVSNPMQLTTTLTYNQGLHMRAVLPHGAVHFSVVFSPGIDPNETAGLGEDEADNTVLSLYDLQGSHIGGMIGPLPQVMVKLVELLPS